MLLASPFSNPPQLARQPVSFSQKEVPLWTCLVLPSAHPAWPREVRAVEARLLRHQAARLIWADLPGYPPEGPVRVLCRAPLDGGGLRSLRQLAAQFPGLEVLAVVGDSEEGRTVQQQLAGAAVVPVERAEWEKAQQADDPAWLPLPLRATPWPARFAEAELDRLARLEFMHRQALEIARLGGEIQLWLQDLENTASAWLEATQRAGQLTAELAASEADRAARLEVIEQQGHALGEAEGRARRLAGELEASVRQLAESEADRAARLRVIEQQGDALGEAQGRVHCLQAELETLRAQLAAAEDDRAARLRVIEAQGAELDRLRQLAGESRSAAL